MDNFSSYSNKYYRLLPFVAVSFIFGIYYGLYNNSVFNLSFSALFLYTLTFVIIITTVLFIAKKFINNFFNGHQIFIVALVIFSFLTGCLRVGYYDFYQARKLAEFENIKTTYTGVIYDEYIISNSGKSAGVPVNILYAQNENSSANTDCRALIYAPLDIIKGLNTDDTIEFSASFLPPDNKPHSGGFSSKEYIYRSGFSYSEYVKTIELSSKHLKTSGIYYPIVKLGTFIKNKILNSIDQCFPVKNSESALLKGILLGYRDDFIEDQTDAFSNSGLIHITSVSGMHIMFLVMFLAYISRRLRIYKFLNLILFPFLFIYSAASAFTPSVCRAILMLSFITLGCIFHREPDSYNSISASAIILLIANPYFLTSYSFILSFSSTLGIIVFSSPITKKLCSFAKPKAVSNRIANATLSSTALSISAHLGVGYFMARFFNRFSWGSIIANIPITFLTAFTFVGGLFNVILFEIFPQPARLIAQYLLSPALWLINKIADIFSFPFFGIFLPTPPPSFFIVYVLALILLHNYLTKPQ